jgi:hypothetical protein
VSVVDESPSSPLPSSSGSSVVGAEVVFEAFGFYPRVTRLVTQKEFMKFSCCDSFVLHPFMKIPNLADASIFLFCL